MCKAIFASTLRSQKGRAGVRTHLVHVALVGHDVGHHERTHQPQLRNVHDGQIASREIQAQVVDTAVWLDVAGQQGMNVVGINTNILREVVLIETAVRVNDSQFEAVEWLLSGC